MTPGSLSVVTGFDSGIAMLGALGVAVVFGLGSVQRTGGQPGTIQLLLSRIVGMLPATFVYWCMIAFGLLYELKEHTLTQGVLVDAGLALVAIAFANWGQWLLNDIFDKETDRHSNADRVTTQGQLSDRTTIASGVALTVLSVLLVLPLGLYAVVSLLGFVVVFLIYSAPPIRLKSNAYTCMFAIGALGGLCFLLGSSVVVASPEPFTLGLFVFLTAILMIDVSYKDLKDAEHDEKSDAENFVVRYGHDTVRKALMVGIPVSYFAWIVMFGLYTLVPVAAVLSVVVVYLLANREGQYHRLVHELDVLNGVFLITLGIVYYTA